MLLGGALALFLFGRSVVEAAREFTATAAAFHRVPALASLATLVATYVFTVAVWRSVIVRFGARLGFRDALRLWSYSNLGRYLPGRVWQVVGIVVLGRPHGITPASGGAIAFVNLGLMIGTGTSLGVYFLPDSLPNAGPVRILAVAGAAALALPVVQPRWLEAMIRQAPVRLRGTGPVHVPGRVALVGILAAFSAIWVLQGVSFFLLLRSWSPVSWSELPRLTGAYAISYVTGLLAVFAPGGIGVRENVLAYLLEPLAARGIPVSLAVVGSRLVALFAELLVLFLALATNPRRAPPRTDHEVP